MVGQSVGRESDAAAMSEEAIFLVWDTISMAWTEIGLNEGDYPRVAEQLMAAGVGWEAVEQMAVDDVCGAFAVDSFLILPCMLWMLMPDWGYSEEFLRARMAAWYAKPRWRHYLNPIRLMGYPIARGFSRSLRNKLKQAYLHSC